MRISGYWLLTLSNTDPLKRKVVSETEQFITLLLKAMKTKKMSLE